MKNLETKKNDFNVKIPASPLWNKSIQMQNFRLSDFHAFGGVLLLLLSDFRTKESSYQLLLRIKSMWRKNGPEFTVSYLKECHRLVMKAIAGKPESSLIRVATRRGLPLIIPGTIRLQLEAESIQAIRIILTILSVYRIIPCKGILKLETITAPFKGIAKVLTEEELYDALRPLDYKTINLVKNGKLVSTVTAGPNYPISGLGGVLDAYAFSRHYPQLLENLRVVCETTGLEVINLLEKEIEAIPKWLERLPTLQGGVRLYRKLESLKLGKLSEKLEPAGKIRVFAITDIWTQSALKPLNDYMFRILRIIPQDGTFDQLAPLRSLIDSGCRNLYSFDLSAATDRLPVDLQVQVMTLLRGRVFAENWRDLLVKRPWFHKGVPYYYSVGQPMGALSSWTSLAITHHLLVQVAARRAGIEGWFQNYAVLGDDIVIGHKLVAHNYLSLMTYLGVDINLSKSLESDTGFAEFAKRLIGPKGDVSPVSPKLIWSVLKDPRNLTETIRDIVSRGTSIQTKALKNVIGSVPKSNKLPKDFIWNITGPIGFLNLLGLSPFLGNKTLTEDQLHLVAKATDEVVNRHLVSNYYRAQEEAHKLWVKLSAGLTASPGRMLLPGGQSWDTGPKLGWDPNIKPLKAFAEASKYWFSPWTWTKHSLFRGLPSVEYQLQVQDKMAWKVKYNPVKLRDYSILLEPLGINNQSVYQYLVESFDLVVSPKLGMTDLLVKEVVKPSFSERLKIFRELEEALERNNIAKILEIRRIPEDIE